MQKSATCPWAWEPGSQGVKWPPEIYLGVKHVPQIFLERSIFWYTPTRCCYWGYIIIILYSETRSRTVFFLLSFITHLWIPRNVAVMILIPSEKIVPVHLDLSRGSCGREPRSIDVTGKFWGFRPSQHVKMVWNMGVQSPPWTHYASPPPSMSNTPNVEPVPRQT